MLHDARLMAMVVSMRIRMPMRVMRTLRLVPLLVMAGLATATVMTVARERAGGKAHATKADRQHTQTPPNRTRSQAAH